MKKIWIMVVCAVAVFALVFAAAMTLPGASNDPFGTVKVSQAAGLTSFTFATTSAPYVPASVDLAAGKWAIEAVPRVGVASGSGTTGCLVSIKTNVPNATDYNGSFRVSTDYGWHLQGAQAAHAVIDLSQDTDVQTWLSYSCNHDGDVSPGTNSVSYLFFPISATSGFQYVVSGGLGYALSVKSPATLPSKTITLPAGTWVMEDIPGVRNGGGGSNGSSGGCRFKPNIYGATQTAQQEGSFRAYTNLAGVLEEPGYAVFTTTASSTAVTVNTSYASCSSSGGDSATTERTNFVMYKFFQVQPGRFQYTQGHSSVPLTAGDWTIETSLGVLGAGGNYQGCSFNTYLGGANPPVVGSCSNPSSTCQESERVCTSNGHCTFGGCTARASCQRPFYLGGCSGTWVDGCAGTWNPTPSNAWSQSGGFFVYAGSTQAAGQGSSFLQVNLSSPETVNPYYSIFNCSPSQQSGYYYYNVNGSIMLLFSNSPAPAGTGTITVASENAVTTSSLVDADWSAGFANGSVADPCTVTSVPCTGTERSYPNMPTGIYTLSPSKITSLATKTFVLHSVQQEPVAQKSAGNPILSFLGDLFNVAKAKVVCGWEVINGVATTSTCPAFTPSLSIPGSGDTANFIILWDPVAAISAKPSAVSLNAVAGSSTSTQIKLTNSGATSSILNWWATTSSTSSWLSVWPTSGCLTAGGKAVKGCSDTNGYEYVTLTANASNLGAGTYTGTVTFNGTSTPTTAAKVPNNPTIVAVTLIVGAPPPPLPPNPPSCTFGASPQQIILPEPSTLSWSCANAVSCTLSGGDFGSGQGEFPTGSASVSPTTNTTYTLTCLGSGSGPTNTVTTQATITTRGSNVYEINP